MRRIARFLLGVVPALLLALGTPGVADARPYGYYPGPGGGWVGWGGGYRPGWGGWGYYRPYYGYGYGYGWGLATGAALGWSLAGPWWPGAYWGVPGYAGYVYPPAYFPYGGVTTLALPAAPLEQVYVEQPQAPGHWYYCNAPAGYYPAVSACSQPWIAVTPSGDAGAAAQ